MIVADHRRWHRRKQKSLFLATIADHRRLPPAWKIYEKWVKVFFPSTSKEIINWSLTEIMNFTLNGAILCLGGKFRNTSAVICDDHRCMRTFVHSRSASIGDKRRRSSVTVCDEWELGFKGDIFYYVSSCEGIKSTTFLNWHKIRDYLFDLQTSQARLSTSASLPNTLEVVDVLVWLFIDCDEIFTCLRTSTLTYKRFVLNYFSLSKGHSTPQNKSRS
jgi:hypothetical protein